MVGLIPSTDWHIGKASLNLNIMNTQTYLNKTRIVVSSVNAPHLPTCICHYTIRFNALNHCIDNGLFPVVIDRITNE